MSMPFCQSVGINGAHGPGHRAALGIDEIGVGRE